MNFVNGLTVDMALVFTMCECTAALTLSSTEISEKIEIMQPANLKFGHSSTLKIIGQPCVLRNWDMHKCSALSDPNSSTSFGCKVVWLSVISTGKLVWP